MERKRIDPLQLISLVEARPTIWDKSMNSNRHYLLRIDAWKEISKIMNPNYHTLTKKNQNAYVEMLMRKWTNIRDAWKKTFPEHKRKPYIYEGHLKFLEKNFSRTTNRKTSNADEDAFEGIDEDSDTGTETSFIATNTTYEKRLNEKGNSEEANEANIQIMNVKSVSDDSPHVMFIKGLLPNLNKLNDEEVLDFQIGVINLLQQIRKNSTSKEQVQVPTQNSNTPSSSHDEVKSES